MAVMLNRNVVYRFDAFNTHLIGIIDIDYLARVAIHNGIIFILKTLETLRVYGESMSTNLVTNCCYFLSELDRFIFLHDFVFHPVYVPLRITASHRQKPLNLTKLLVQQAYIIRRIAERSISDSCNFNSSIMNA